MGGQTAYYDIRTGLFTKQPDHGGVFCEVEKEEEMCRICREEAGVLVVVCACQGSIRWVHRECLMQWVLLQKTLECELCKQPFEVSKLYAKDAPHSVPFCYLVADLALAGVLAVLRGIKVACTFSFAWFCLGPSVIALVVHLMLGGGVPVIDNAMAFIALASEGASMLPPLLLLVFFRGLFDSFELSKWRGLAPIRPYREDLLSIRQALTELSTPDEGKAGNGGEENDTKDNTSGEEGDSTHSLSPKNDGGALQDNQEAAQPAIDAGCLVLSLSDDDRVAKVFELFRLKFHYRRLRAMQKQNIFLVQKERTTVDGREVAICHFADIPHLADNATPPTGAFCTAFPRSTPLTTSDDPAHLSTAELYRVTGVDPPQNLTAAAGARGSPAPDVSSSDDEGAEVYVPACLLYPLSVRQALDQRMLCYEKALAQGRLPAETAPTTPLARALQVLDERVAFHCNFVGSCEVVPVDIARLPGTVSEEAQPWHFVPQKSSALTREAVSSVAATLQNNADSGDTLGFDGKLLSKGARRALFPAEAHHTTEEAPHHDTSAAGNALKTNNIVKILPVLIAQLGYLLWAPVVTMSILLTTADVLLHHAATAATQLAPDAYAYLSEAVATHVYTFGQGSVAQEWDAMVLAFAAGVKTEAMLLLDGEEMELEEGSIDVETANVLHTFADIQNMLANLKTHHKEQGETNAFSAASSAEDATQVAARVFEETIKDITTHPALDVLTTRVIPGIILTYFVVVPLLLAVLKVVTKHINSPKMKWCLLKAQEWLGALRVESAKAACLLWLFAHGVFEVVVLPTLIGQCIYSFTSSMLVGGAGNVVLHYFSLGGKLYAESTNAIFFQVSEEGTTNMTPSNLNVGLAAEEIFGATYFMKMSPATPHSLAHLLDTPSTWTPLFWMWYMGELFLFAACCATDSLISRTSQNALRIVSALFHLEELNEPDVSVISFMLNASMIKQGILWVGACLYLLFLGLATIRAPIRVAAAVVPGVFPIPLISSRGGMAGEIFVFNIAIIIDKLGMVAVLSEVVRVVLHAIAKALGLDELFLHERTGAAQVELHLANGARTKAVPTAGVPHFPLRLFTMLVATWVVAACLSIICLAFPFVLGSFIPFREESSLMGNVLVGLSIVLTVPKCAKLAWVGVERLRAFLNTEQAAEEVPMVEGKKKEEKKRQPVPKVDERGEEKRPVDTDGAKEREEAVVEVELPAVVEVVSDAKGASVQERGAAEVRQAGEGVSVERTAAMPKAVRHETKPAPVEREETVNVKVSEASQPSVASLPAPHVPEKVVPEVARVPEVEVAKVVKAKVEKAAVPATLPPMPQQARSTQPPQHPRPQPTPGAATPSPHTTPPPASEKKAGDVAAVRAPAAPTTTAPTAAASPAPAPATVAPAASAATPAASVSKQRLAEHSASKITSALPPADSGVSIVPDVLFTSLLLEVQSIAPDAAVGRSLLDAAKRGVPVHSTIAMTNIFLFKSGLLEPERDIMGNTVGLKLSKLRRYHDGKGMYIARCVLKTLDLMRLCIKTSNSLHCSPNTFLRQPCRGDTREH